MTIGSMLQPILRKLEINAVVETRSAKTLLGFDFLDVGSPDHVRSLRFSPRIASRHKGDRHSEFFDDLAGFLTNEFQSRELKYALNVNAEVLRSGLIDRLGSISDQCSAIFAWVPSTDFTIGRDLSQLVKLFPLHDFRCVDIIVDRAAKKDYIFVYERDRVPSTEFCVFTSIPPRLSDEAVSAQREILASWRAAGFEPISVNGPQEALEIAAFNFGIEILPIEEDGKPTIAAILGAIRERGVSRAGLINSDCRVIPYPNLGEKLSASLERTFLYAERIDIGDNKAPSLGECRGFDAFFFDVDILTNIADRGFRLGETWWDYWFPLQLAANEAKCGKIELPLLLHQRHRTRWSYSQWITNGKTCWAGAQAWSAAHQLPAFLSPIEAVMAARTPDKEGLLEFGNACFDAFRSVTFSEYFTSPDLESDLRDLYKYFEDGYSREATYSQQSSKKKKSFFHLLNRRRLNFQRHFLGKSDRLS